MSGSITGQVLNQRDGQPIEGATCSCGSSAETQTDAKGHFAFPDLGAGSEYELIVRKAGFEAGIYGPLVVVDDNPTQLTLTLQPKNI